MLRRLPALVLAAVVLWPSGAAAAVWRWPVRGEVAGRFAVTSAAPFAAGQRRGIDVAAPPGSRVRAACSGRVAFAGPVPARGRAVTVVCGALRATYLRLGSLSVRAGARVRTGATLGRLGARGLLRLGARRAAERFGYVDPLTLLRAPGRRAPPPLVMPPARVRLLPRARPVRAPPSPAMPWAAWLGLALAALLGGGAASSLGRRWAPSTSRPRSTTSTRPRTWVTRTPRSPPT